MDRRKPGCNPQGLARDVRIVRARDVTPDAAVCAAVQAGRSALGYIPGMFDLALLQQQSEAIAKAIVWFRDKTGEDLQHWQCIEAELARLARANRELRSELRHIRAGVAK